MFKESSRHWSHHFAAMPSTRRPLRRLVDEQLRAGIDGFVPVGTTGESPRSRWRSTSHYQDRGGRDAQARASDCRDRRQLHREAIELTREARAVGADGTLQVTPYYNRPRRTGSSAISRPSPMRCRCPCWCTTCPAARPATFCPKPWRGCARCLPWWASRSHGSAQRAAQIISRVGDRMVVLSRRRMRLPSAVRPGRARCYSVVVQRGAAEMAAMWDAAVAGN